MKTANKSAPAHVLVIGASGELGGALALRYAADGVCLSLWGRDPGRLQAIAEACRIAGAVSTHIRAIDLEDLDAALATLRRDDTEAPIDTALFAAGLGDIRNAGDLFEDAGLIARLGRVNFLAPAVLGAELASRMARRGHGRMAFIGSAAGFHPLPFASAYAGSKAGLARFCEALRIAMKPHGVAITLVSPGFIDTAAARRVPGPKPLALSPDTAARRIARAVAKGEPHVIVPRIFALLRLIDRALPAFLRDRMLRALTPPDRRPDHPKAAPAPSGAVPPA